MKGSARIAYLLAAGLGVAAQAWAAEPASRERGQLLYENHCVRCHTSKVHRRTPPLPLNARELRQIVSTWASGEQLNWTEQDVADVAEYLERNYYRTLPR